MKIQAFQENGMPKSPDEHSLELKYWMSTLMFSLPHREVTDYTHMLVIKWSGPLQKEKNVGYNISPKHSRRLSALTIVDWLEPLWNGSHGMQVLVMPGFSKSLCALIRLHFLLDIWGPCQSIANQQSFPGWPCLVPQRRKAREDA